MSPYAIASCIMGDILLSMGKKRNDLNEYNRGPSIAVIAFVVTLLAVLSIGGIFLLILHSAKTQKSDNIVDQTISKWELIPESAWPKVNDGTDQAEDSDGSDSNQVQIEIPEEDKDYTHLIETTYGDSVTIGFAGDILFDTNYAVGNAFSRSGNSAAGVIGDSLLSRMNTVDIMMVNNAVIRTKITNRIKRGIYHKRV